MMCLDPHNYFSSLCFFFFFFHAFSHDNRVPLFRYQADRQYVGVGNHFDTFLMTCGIATNLCEQSAPCRNHLHQPQETPDADIAPKATAASCATITVPRTICATLTHAVVDFLFAAGLQTEHTSPTESDAAAEQSANKQETVLTEDLILGGYMCILLGCTIIDNPANATTIGQVLRDRMPDNLAAADGGVDNEKQEGPTGCAAPLIRVICGFLNFQVLLGGCMECRATHHLIATPGTYPHNLLNLVSWPLTTATSTHRNYRAKSAF